MKKLFLITIIGTGIFLYADMPAYGTPEFKQILKRASEVAAIKSGCKTQAELTCYLENEDQALCKKVGINTYYQTCLNLSDIETGTADKKDVIKALKKKL